MHWKRNIFAVGPSFSSYFIYFLSGFSILILLSFVSSSILVYENEDNNLYLWCMYQTPTHVCLITDFCPGGEMFALLDRQPMKIFKEEAAKYIPTLITLFRGNFVCTFKMPKLTTLCITLHRTVWGMPSQQKMIKISHILIIKKEFNLHTPCFLINFKSQTFRTIYIF